MTNYKLPSYGKVYALGHRAIANIFKGPVIIQEKVDGSQITFGRINGELFIRSKGKQLVLDAPEKLFAKGVKAIEALDLRDGWVYRAEYLKNPKHNTLAYNKIPAHHVILFDAHPDKEGHGYLNPTELEGEANRLGLQSVPVLKRGIIKSVEELEGLLDNESVLGGQKIEGFVVKNYNQFNSVDGRFCVGKYVSEAFKEKHQGEWKKTNPSSSDVVDHLITQLKTEARWNKAVQHLRELGELDESPKDIGNLIKRVSTDVLEEEIDTIRDVLFKHFWPKIKRGITGGLPEWYKEQVLVHAFPAED